MTSTRMASLAAALAAVLAGCTTQSVDYCDGVGQCGTNRICDVVLNRCIPAPVDAAPPPPDAGDDEVDAAPPDPDAAAPPVDAGPQADAEPE
jgi:hypothetical protein